MAKPRTAYSTYVNLNGGVWVLLCSTLQDVLEDNLAAH